MVYGCRVLGGGVERKDDSKKGNAVKKESASAASTSTSKGKTKNRDVVTANGQKAAPDGKRLGPSGKPEYHYSNSATRKQAVDGAKQQGGGQAVKDPATAKQPQHLHSLDKSGERVSGPQKTHFNVRGDKPKEQ